MPNNKQNTPRWYAVVSYRCRRGRVEAEDFYLDELDEAWDMVQDGPDWDTVLSIVIQRINHDTSPTLTVERAAKL